MTVQVIRAKTAPAFTSDGDASLPILRAACYCRVSTDSSDQESSYEAQCSHYTTMINEDPHLCMAGLYADEGISGTSLKNREGFNRMIADCEAGKIDVVYTKSISRFARNTVDCLNAIRKLKALGVEVVFEKEGIRTLDAKGESVPTDLIQNHYKPLGEKPLYIKVGRFQGVFSFVSISGKRSDAPARFGYKIILP